MTGGRLLVLGGPATDAAGIVSRLTTCGRACLEVSPGNALVADCMALPGTVVIPIFGFAGPAPLPDLLDALEEVSAHAVFVADAGFAPPPGVRVLRGFDAAGVATVLDILDDAGRERQTLWAWQEAFLSSFSGVAAICDAAFRVLHCNPALRQRAGGALDGKPCYTAMHGRNAPCPWCPLEETLKGRTVTMEIQSPLDGRYFSMTSAPLLQPDGRPAMLSLLADVTDRNMAVSRLKTLNRDLERRVVERTDVLSRQTDELAEANARLLELDALKSGFLATVTHDLRTPLTSVMGFAKLTRRDFVKDFMPFSEVSDALRRKGARIADNLRIIENEGARLTRLVNDFLDLSKIESGRLNWNDRDTDPAEVVRAAVAAVGGEYEQNERLALVVDIPPGLPILRLDPDRLMQVLVNLLTNAARHTGEGEVTLSARMLPAGRLEFRVADTGPGIPEAERERIFDKYYQAKRGDTTGENRRGTGLGLTICKHIVERYGGVIRAEARQPRGTAFVVELPGRSVPSGPKTQTAPDCRESSDRTFS